MFIGTFEELKKISENSLHLLKLPLLKNWEFLSSENTWKSKKESQFSIVPCFSLLSEIFTCLSFSRFTVIPFSSLFSFTGYEHHYYDFKYHLHVHDSQISLSSPDYILVLDPSSDHPLGRDNHLSKFMLPLPLHKGVAGQWLTNHTYRSKHTLSQRYGHMPNSLNWMLV